MPCQVGSEPVSEQAADVTAGRMAVVAAKTAAPLPSRERGRTVDGIIIFKSCMGCIFSALSSVSRPAEITPVSRECIEMGQQTNLIRPQSALFLIEFGVTIIIRLFVLWRQLCMFFLLHANTYWELDGLLTCGNVLGAKEQLFGHSLLLFFAHTHVPLV